MSHPMDDVGAVGAHEVIRRQSAGSVPAAEILRALQELADATHRLIGSLPLEDRGFEAGAANVKVRQALALVSRARSKEGRGTSDGA